MSLPAGLPGADRAARSRKVAAQAALWNAIAWALFAANCWLLRHQLLSR